MPDISIIIVNYNVKYYLEACLLSVNAAINNLNAEVIIVDNNSKDGSCEYIKKHFPQFQLIENKNNTGFAKANNQAIKISRGKYILLLNPDTIVGEDTFEKCIRFMEQHPDSGALGVHMVDGAGIFLPESKRALPTPVVSFYKAFGLSAIFPKSKHFGRYHLGFLDKEQTHPIEVISGAFMMLRRMALEKTGLLDEDYFMYGEDIDLSYRVILSGYSNYYFADAHIIHFKGESTKKGSLNYVMIFYKAMEIFARKHFTKKRLSVYHLIINAAIYFRATLAILKRIVQAFFNPIMTLSNWGCSKLQPKSKKLQILFIGSDEEKVRVERVLTNKGQAFNTIQLVNNDKLSVQNLIDLIKEKAVDHVIFSLSDASFGAMIQQVETLSTTNVKISFLVAHADELIGS